MPTKIRRAAACTALFMALAGSVAGCAGLRTQEGYRQAMDSWIGSTGEQLVAQWGPPAQEHTSPDGAKLYQYRDQRDYRVSGGTRQERVLLDGHYVYVDLPQPDQTETIWCNTTFRINKDDIIEGYYFTGPDCTTGEK
jgi:hypothetical protein